MLNRPGFPERRVHMAARRRNTRGRRSRKPPPSPLRPVRRRQEGKRASPAAKHYRRSCSPRGRPPKFRPELGPSFAANLIEQQWREREYRRRYELAQLRSRQRQRRNLIFLQWIGLLGAPPEVTAESWGVSRTRMRRLCVEIQWQWVHGRYARGNAPPTKP